MLIPPANEIHIWRADLDAETPRDEILSTPERERAARFFKPEHRTRYANAHIALREILGCYGIALPLEFQTNAYGKPFFREPAPIQFNLSHSNACALIAVTQNRPVGIDIESIRDKVDTLPLARRFFAPREVELVAQDPARFFEIWTRKEAFIKAIGMGVSFPLHEFDVCDSQINLYSPAQRLSRQEWFGQTDWFAKTLFPAPNYIAAVVVSAPNLNVKQFDWKDAG